MVLAVEALRINKASSASRAAILESPRYGYIDRAPRRPGNLVPGIPRRCTAKTLAASHNSPRRLGVGPLTRSDDGLSGSLIVLCFHAPDVSSSVVQSAVRRGATLCGSKGSTRVSDSPHNSHHQPGTDGKAAVNGGKYPVCRAVMSRRPFVGAWASFEASSAQCRSFSAFPVAAVLR